MVLCLVILKIYTGHFIGCAALHLDNRTQLAAHAIESFLYLAASKGDGVLVPKCSDPLAYISKASVASTKISEVQVHEWMGQLELVRNCPTSAAIAFESALTVSSDVPMHIIGVASALRSNHRAVMGLVETSLFAGKFQRAVGLLENAAISCNSLSFSEQEARVYHLQARAYAGLGHASTALDFFSRAIAAYTTFVQNQGLTTEISAVTHDLRDPYKRPHRIRQCGHKRPVDNKTHASRYPLTTAQQGRAMAYYHRSLFHAAMAFKLKTPVATIRQQNSRGTRKLNTQSPQRPSEEVDDFNSSMFDLPAIIKTYIQRGGLSFCNKASTEPLAHKIQNHLHSAVACLLNMPTLGDSQLSFSASREALLFPDQTSTPEMKQAEPRYNSEALDALGLEDLTEALKQNPTLVDARLVRAELHIAGGNYAFAFADFDAVLNFSPLCANARINRGVLLLQLQHNIDARADLDEAISVLDNQQNLGGNKTQVSFENQPKLSLALALCLRNQCLYIKWSLTAMFKRYGRAICFAAASDLENANSDFSRTVDLLHPLFRSPMKASGTNGQWRSALRLMASASRSGLKLYR